MEDSLVDPFFSWRANGCHATWGRALDLALRHGLVKVQHAPFCIVRTLEDARLTRRISDVFN
eukprot:6473915-Amphidinium_carterae.1